MATFYLILGEFEDAFYSQKSDIHEKVGSFADLFLNFHPETRPVLWRILVIQAHIYKALLYIRELKEATPTSRSQDIENILLKSISQEDRRKFDWRQKAEEASDNEVLTQPFEVAHAYLHDSLESLKSNLV